jgi:hypothetical protein
MYALGVVPLGASLSPNLQEKQLQDLYVRRGVGFYVGNLREPLFQQADGAIVINAMIQLRLQINES